MQNNSVINKKNLIYVGVVFVILSIIIIILAILQSSTDNSVLRIDNFDQYITNISDDERTNILKKIHSFINTQNSINNKEQKPSYQARIRDDSVEITQKTIDNQKISRADLILDIEELQYSYRVIFSWFTQPITNQDIILDLGTVNLYCLNSDESIYNNFNCEQNPSITKIENPILTINPIIYDGCWFSPYYTNTSKSGYGVTIIFYPSDDDINNNTIDSSQSSCINKTKQTLKDADIDLDTIEIKTEIQFF